MNDIQKVTDEIIALMREHKDVLTEVLRNEAVQRTVKEARALSCKHVYAGLLRPESALTDELQVKEFNYCPLCGVEL